MQTQWDESFKAGRDYNPLNELLLDAVLAQHTGSSKTALDLGCGTGDAAVKLAQRGFTVTATDWSPAALEKARIRAEDAHVLNKIVWKELDLNSITTNTFGHSTVDFILCKLVVAFVTDKKKFCETVKTLLSEGGVFVLQTPVLHKGIEYTLEDKPNIAVSYEEFIALIHDVFSTVIEFNHSYYGERGDLVTLIVK